MEPAGFNRNIHEWHGFGFRDGPKSQVVIRRITVVMCIETAYKAHTLRRVGKSADDTPRVVGKRSITFWCQRTTFSKSQAVFVRLSKKTWAAVPAS